MGSHFGYLLSFGVFQHGLRHFSLSAFTGYLLCLVCFQVVFDAFWKHRRVAIPSCRQVQCLYHTFCWTFDTIWVDFFWGSICQAMGTDDAAFRDCLARIVPLSARHPQRLLLFKIGSCVARVRNAQAKAHPHTRENMKNARRRLKIASRTPSKRHFRQMW